MYENMTYDIILKRMLSRIPDTFDKREGSIIYDSLASAAVEIQNWYIQLDVVLNESYADTASRPSLIKMCNERGVPVKTATFAIRQGEFNINVPIGSRFSLNKLNYVVTEKIENGIFKLECETAGIVGNLESGTLIPIEYIDGLQTALLTNVLVPGEDDEATEVLRQKYSNSYESQSFGGNVAYYKEKVNSLDGVGGVKVKRAWDGGGTVGLVIINSSMETPTPTLIDSVQEAVDPIGHQGEGLGIAPIDHVVTVVGCEESMINIQTSITYQEGWNWASVKSHVTDKIDEYFKELSSNWEASDKNGLVVRISQIETRLLDVEGILDVTNTTLNGSTQNVSIPVDNIPIRGSITNV